ncbi:unnamed protein product [Discula destructiva]
MSSYSPTKPHVRRERARFEEIERASRGELRERQSSEKHRTDRGPATTPAAAAAGPRPAHARSKSASASSSSSSLSASEQQASPSKSDRPSTAGTQQTTPVKISYPNYYDYSENSEDINKGAAPSLLQTPRRTTASMAMQVPIHPPQQQSPHQRLVDLPQQSQAQTQSLSRPSPQSAQATPRQTSGPALTTAQLQQAVARGGPLHLNGNSNATSHSRVPSTGTRERPPSYAGPNGALRSPADDAFPPNKVDIDAARYRQAQSRASRERSSTTTTDRGSLAKDLREGRRTSQTNGPPPSMNMGLPHHSGGRPASPDSLPTPTGHNIRRLSTPSVPNSVLQPLDAKVVEYGTLMADAQGEMSRLDEEMRLLQDRQREVEQRFLEAKAKHDDYRRQYSDVERALRGEFATNARERRNMDREDSGPVPPVPSMPNLQQYGVDSRQGSGMALNGHNGSQGHPGMRSQRTVSIQSDMDGEMSRPGSKRGRFSRLFGV